MGDVAEHYNARPNKGAQERRSSPIFHLRAFNNWIKSVLIKEAMHVLHSCSIQHMSVLDVACGKGGDLGKFKKSFSMRLKEYVGVDVAKVSVEHAQDRVRLMRPPFRCSFHAFDAFGGDLRNVISGQFELVSCQFALHYAFKTEETAKNAVRNVSLCMSDRSVFICTIPNAQLILERFGKKALLNEHYKIEFSSEQPVSEGYGCEYTFWLSDAIDSCPEYLVNLELLKALFEGHSVHLKEALPFNEFYLKYGVDHFELLECMDVIDRKHRLKLSRAEMAIAELYLAIIFTK